MNTSVQAARQGKIRVGLVGAGHWAEYGHIPSFQLLADDYEITAVYSRSQDKADAVAARHGIRYALDSLQALVRHAEVDFVVVLNPAFGHEEAIRAAIAAGKDVYSEWPLTPSKALSQELMDLADKAGVRHIVGLQRRLGPDYRYVRDLLKDGHIGALRSVRLHVSVEYFQQQRIASLYYTVPEKNFSSLLSIYGGHFFDAIFTMLGFPQSLSAQTINQFKSVTLIETGEVMPHASADQVVLAGVFPNGAALSVHLEAGKRNNFGVQLDLTGSKGDIRLSNTTSFGLAFNVLEAAVGDAQPLQVLAIPAAYDWLPAHTLGGSQAELANLYAAYAQDVREGTQLAPTFAAGMKMHELIEQIVDSDQRGVRVVLK